MLPRPTNERNRWSGVSGRPAMRSVATGYLAVTIAAAAAGCAATPRPADPGAQAAGSSSADRGKSTGLDQSRSSDSGTVYQAKATDRQRFQVHIDFGRAFEGQGNLDAAIKEYQDALAVVENRRRGPFRPSDEALAHRRIGSAMDRMGRFAQAETHYNKALKLRPKDPKIWNDAGYSYYLQGRWADAERALKTAARFDPDDERVRINLGLTLAAAGRAEEALPLLSQASGDAIGHANLGYLLAATGQLELARQQYETALAMRPDLEVARRALAKIDVKDPDSRSRSRPPALMARGTRSTVHPIDPGVTQATMANVKIPPPLPSRILPTARAPSMVDRPDSRDPADAADRALIPAPPAL
jgi:Flp pilus assembly protein TadD